MGLERVTYLEKDFYEHSIIISRVQVFLYNYILNSKYNLHLPWLDSVLGDLYGNSRIPVPKYFFDEEELEPYPERKSHILKLMKKALQKMEDMTITAFFLYIEKDSKDTFFEIENKDSTDNGTYNFYLDTIKKVIDQLN